MGDERQEVEVSVARREARAGDDEGRAAPMLQTSAPARGHMEQEVVGRVGKFAAEERRLPGNDLLGIANEALHVCVRHGIGGPDCVPVWDTADLKGGRTKRAKLDWRVHEGVEVRGGKLMQGSVAAARFRASGRSRGFPS